MDRELGQAAQHHETSPDKQAEATSAEEMQESGETKTMYLSVSFLFSYNQILRSSDVCLLYLVWNTHRGLGQELRLEEQSP